MSAHLSGTVRVRVGRGSSGRRVGWIAVCDCGWKGRARVLQVRAVADARNHRWGRKLVVN